MDSLFYFFLPLLPGQDSASANFGHELLTIDDITDMDPLADHPFGIAGPDIEGELTPFDFGQHGGCDDFGTDARRLDMGHVHLGTDSRRTLRQMVGHSLHRRIFHQGHHSRRSEYLQVARSHRRSHVAAIDRYLTLCRKSFFHHNTTVFYCVNNSESLSLNIALDRMRLGKPGTSPVFSRLSLSLQKIGFGSAIFACKPARLLSPFTIFELRRGFEIRPLRTEAPSPPLCFILTKVRKFRFR